MAQLLPMSDEMIASFGKLRWIARQAIRGLIFSGSRPRARSFQLVPGSSSSWSIEDNCCAQADLVCAILAFRSARPASPAVAESCARRLCATLFASPTMPTLTGLVNPIRSGFRST